MSREQCTDIQPPPQDPHSACRSAPWGTSPICCQSPRANNLSRKVRSDPGESLCWGTQSPLSPSDHHTGPFRSCRPSLWPYCCQLNSAAQHFVGSFHSKDICQTQPSYYLHFPEIIFKDHTAVLPKTLSETRGSNNLSLPLRTALTLQRPGPA